MKKTLFLLLLCSKVFAQTEELVDQVTKSSYEGKSYLYSKSVTLLPGFQVSALANGVFYIRPSPAALPQDDVAPSSNKNYVGSEIILVRGITTESQISGLTPAQKNVSYEYYDGSERIIQSVQRNASPNNNDLVKLFNYDQYGRVKKDYLPYAATDQSGSYKVNALADQQTFYTNTQKTASDTRPYVEYDYEMSPLNRVTQIFGAGDLWKNANVSKSVKTKVLVNIDNIVRRWTINTSSLPTTSNWYPAGTLLISCSIDESDRSIKQYADMRGNVVMSDNNGLITYYVYDEMGLLKFILPPEYIKNYPLTTISISPTQADLNTWAFQFKYDDRRRLSEKKGPGVDNDWIFLVYDEWDRLVVKQDGVQRSKSPKEWSFIKYDGLNRAIMTGILQTTLQDHASMIAAVTGTRAEVENTSVLGYTLTKTFPSTLNTGITTITPLIVSYYDDYSFLSNAGWAIKNDEYKVNMSNSLEASLPIITIVRGHVTGSKTKLLGSTNTWLPSVYYYNNRYEKVFNIRQEALRALPDGNTSATNLADRIINVYNFDGTITDSYRNSPDITIHERYVYESSGRLDKTYHSINSAPEVLLADNNYNELGQLVETNLHSNDGTNFLQSIDYRYNIRGWLSSINNSTLTVDASNDDTNDLFGMNLVYNDETLTVNGTASHPMYDGNISAVKWKTDNKKSIPKEKSYAYYYDAQDRMQQAHYAAKSSTGAWTDEAGFYDIENLQYDNNGNIQTLKRYGKSGSTRVIIDDLTYDYTTKGNQLTNVEDSNGNSFGYPNATAGINPEMQYDKNGNLTSDLNTQTTSVTYNYLNLPELITIDLPNTTADYTVEYSYDATGYLVKKIIKKGGVPLKTTDYAHGVQYFDGQPTIIFTSNGRATLNANNGNYEYEYFIRDHLTNTRLAFGWLHSTDVYKATIELANDANETQTQGFKNITASRYQNALYNHTTKTLDIPSPDRSAKLNGYSGAFIGPAKLLQVKVGDRVKMETYARYDATTTSNTIVPNLVAAVTGAYGIVNSGQTQVAFQAISTSLPSLSSQMARLNSAPKAYLFYVLFDNNYVFKQFGYAMADVDGLLKYQKLALDIVLPSDGYLYIYVANESKVSAATAAYFDDFQIIHEKTVMDLRVTESSDYDPFGMMLEGTAYTDVSGAANNYKYQGDYAEYEAITGWNRFEGRGNYDARLGRWNSVDPASQFPGMSPYTGMANNGARYTDPDGEFIPLIIAVGAVIGGVTNTYSHWENIHGFMDGVNYFSVGAVSGAVTTVNPLAGATIMAVGNAAIEIIHGRTPDPLAVSTDFIMTYIPGKAALNASNAASALEKEMLSVQAKMAAQAAKGGKEIVLIEGAEKVAETEAGTLTATVKQSAMKEGESVIEVTNLEEFVITASPLEGGGLLEVSKAVNSNLSHAIEQGVSRGIFSDAKTASKSLKDLTQSISKNGFPEGAFLDPSKLDRVLVPVGDGGLAVYQVGKNGTAALKTVLIAR